MTNQVAANSHPVTVRQKKKPLRDTSGFFREHDFNWFFKGLDLWIGFFGYWAFSFVGYWFFFQGYWIHQRYLSGSIYKKGFCPILDRNFTNTKTGLSRWLIANREGIAGPGTL
jgi:hypothetical protein